jgi:hypothetical protein
MLGVTKEERGRRVWKGNEDGGRRRRWWWRRMKWTKDVKW